VTGIDNVVPDTEYPHSFSTLVGYKTHVNHVHTAKSNLVVEIISGDQCLPSKDRRIVSAGDVQARGALYVEGTTSRLVLAQCQETRCLAGSVYYARLSHLKEVTASGWS